MTLDKSLSRLQSLLSRSSLRVLEALFVALTSSCLWTGVDDHPEELRLPMHTPDRTTSRTSSSSSDSSTNLHSPNPSVSGADTPLAQSDEEDGDEGGAEPGASS